MAREHTRDWDGLEWHADRLKTAREAVSKVLGRLDVKGRLAFMPLWRGWAEAVGPELAEYAHPLEVRGRTLVLGGHDPVVLQEIAYVQNELLARVNAYLGKEYFDKVTFELLSDRIPLDAAIERPAPLPRQEPPKPERLGALDALWQDDSAVARCYRAYVRFFAGR
jgi:hypothetical protein